MRFTDPTSAVQTIRPEVKTFLKNPLMTIGGKQVSSETSETFEVFNPATGEVLARVPKASAGDVDRAVRAARAAFEGPWSEMMSVEHQRLMLKLADLIEENREELAELETPSIRVLTGEE